MCSGNVPGQPDPARSSLPGRRRDHGAQPIEAKLDRGERFGEFTLRAGYVAKTANGRDFHANVGLAR